MAQQVTKVWFCGNQKSLGGFILRPTRVTVGSLHFTIKFDLNYVHHILSEKNEVGSALSSFGFDAA